MGFILLYGLALCGTPASEMPLSVNFGVFWNHIYCFKLESPDEIWNVVEYEDLW